MKVAKTVNLKSSHHKKNEFCNYVWWWMLIDLLWWLFHSIYKYRIIMCSPKTNIVCQLYLSKKKTYLWRWCWEWCGWWHTKDEMENVIHLFESSRNHGFSGWKDLRFLSCWSNPDSGIAHRLSGSDSWGHNRPAFEYMRWSESSGSGVLEKRKHGFSRCYLSCQNRRSGWRGEPTVKISWFPPL